MLGNKALIGLIYSGRRYVSSGTGVIKRYMDECNSYLHLGGFVLKSFDVYIDF